MASKRLLSRSITTSEKFNRLLPKNLEAKGVPEPYLAMLLYVLMIPFTDDYGRLDGSLFWVKANIFPCLPVSEEKIQSLLTSLDDVGLIHYYSYGDPVRKCIEIINFDVHQPGIKHKSKSCFPNP
jgi:hypothetical protein